MNAWQEALDSMPTPSEEPIKGKTLIADGWVYRDFPRMPIEKWDALLTAIGYEENIKMLTCAFYRTGQSHEARGQLIISPEGIRRLERYEKEEV